MPIRQIGGGAPIQGRASLTIDRINGDSVRWTWRGIYADLLSLADTLSLDPDNTVISLSPEPDSPLGVLEQIQAQSLPDGTEEVPVDTIELNWYRREKPIWFAPNLAVLNPTDRGVILKAVSDFETDGTMPAFSATPGNAQFVSNVTAASHAFGILAIGDTYQEFTATLSWLRAVSQQFATTVGASGVNKIHTTTALQNRLNTGPVIPIFFTLAQIVPPIGTPGTAYTIGWMKTEASVNIAANGKALLREQWEYGSYNNFMYQTISS